MDGLRRYPCSQRNRRMQVIEVRAGTTLATKLLDVSPLLPATQFYELATIYLKDPGGLLCNVDS